MKRHSEDEDLSDDLLPEYDLKTLLKGGEQGKYVERYQAGTNLVRLDPDIAKAFSDARSSATPLRFSTRINSASSCQ